MKERNTVEESTQPKQNADSNSNQEVKTNLHKGILT